MRRFHFIRKDENVGLAVIDEQDADFLVEHLNNPEITRFKMRRTPLCRPQALEMIRNAQSSDSEQRFIVVRKSSSAKRSHTPVGCICLHRINFIHRSAITSTWIARESQRNGYARRAKNLLLDFAFNGLGLHAIHARVMASNEGSIACNKRCGYREVGRLSEALTDERGNRQDQVLFEILRSEWLKAKN